MAAQLGVAHAGMERLGGRELQFVPRCALSCSSLRKPRDRAVSAFELTLQIEVHPTTLVVAAGKYGVVNKPRGPRPRLATGDPCGLLAGGSL